MSIASSLAAPIRKALLSLTALSSICGVHLVRAQITAATKISLTVLGDEQSPLSSVTVEVSQNGSVIATGKSDANGVVQVSCPLHSHCLVSARLPDYKVVQIEVAAESQEQDLSITLIRNVQSSVTVNAAADDPIATTSVNETTLPVDQAKATPLRPATLTDMLPLVPGVVRMPDGRVQIGGMGEEHSALLVNSVDVTDPATGSFGLSIPVDTVDVLKVAQSPYLAQYGNFTSGVVTTETRRGGDKWKFDLNDPLPEVRIRSGHLVGLRALTPRVNLSGPLVRNRLYFLEGSEYLMHKDPVRTLPFPLNEIRSTAFNSFTQLDGVLTSNQTITASLHFAPHRVKFVNLNYFDPQSVTPNGDYQEDTGTITHHFGIAGGVLSSAIAGTRVAANVAPQAAGAMILSPIGNSGNYFGQSNRESTRFQWLETWAPSNQNWHGTHAFQAGAILAFAENDGSFLARDVQIVDASGHLLRTISFTGNGNYDVSDLEPSFYVQDHWMVNPHVALDLGWRWETQSVTYTHRSAPRAGFTWSIAGNTVLRGGTGVFYDQVPLDTYAFSSRPQQIVTTYDGRGNVVDGPRQYQNVIEVSGEASFPFLDQEEKQGNLAPYSLAWNVVLEQKVHSLLLLRMGYLDNNAHNQLTLSPGVTANRAALTLGSAGAVQSHQLSFTAGVGTNAKRQFFLSYVRQFTRGNVTDASSYLGDFPSPVVRSPLVASVPGEVPNRFLFWGTADLPWRMHLSPHVEYRNGFPYQPVDALQNYVDFGSYQARYPRYFSLNARIGKDVSFGPKHAVRFSLSGINLTNHNNPLQVHNNTADPQFGSFFGNYGRHLLLDFDFLY